MLIAGARFSLPSVFFLHSISRRRLLERWCVPRSFHSGTWLEGQRFATGTWSERRKRPTRYFQGGQFIEFEVFAFQCYSSHCRTGHIKTLNETHGQILVLTRRTMCSVWSICRTSLLGMISQFFDGDDFRGALLDAQISCMTINECGNKCTA